MEKSRSCSSSLNLRRTLEIIMKAKKNWIPSIEYESDESGEVSDLPFINVPMEHAMPSLLWFWEHRETGEFEVGPKGKELPIVERDLHQYVDMKKLYSFLSPEMYDKFRVTLGLKPLKVATKEGQQLTNKIKENITEISMQVENAQKA